MTPPCGGSGTTSSNTSARVPGARDAAGRGRATRKCAAAGVAESGTLRVGRPRPAGARPRTPPRRPSPPRRAPTRAERAAGRGPSGRGAAARDPAPRLSGAPAATGSHPLARGRGRSALRPPRGLAVGVEGGWRWPRGRGGRARGRGGHRSPPDCAIVLRHNVAHALGRVRDGSTGAEKLQRPRSLATENGRERTHLPLGFLRMSVRRRARRTPRCKGV